MRAFSLVELSIVLVILGLLTGGILAGQSLIRAAELRSIVTDYQRYTIARQAFHDRYMAMPGDFRNATRFWGRSSGEAWCVSNTGVTAGTSGTCDGDGNGALKYGGANQSSEPFQFWNHLALAGLIEGTYTGLAGASGPYDHDFGSNAPIARIANAGWGAGYQNNATGATSAIFSYDFTNSFIVGGDDGIWADTPRFKAEESWNIDTKLDDGKPATGKLIVYPVGGNCNNATSNTDWSATYALSNTSSNACTPIFLP